MNELMLLLAKVLPKEKLIEMLSESIDEYKLTPTDDQFKKVASICSIILGKMVTETEDISKTLEDMRRMEQGFDMLSPKDH